MKDESKIPVAWFEVYWARVDVESYELELPALAYTTAARIIDAHAY